MYVDANTLTNCLSTNRIKVRFKDVYSLKSRYQEWEERPMIPMMSSSGSTSNIPKVNMDGERIIMFMTCSDLTLENLRFELCSTLGTHGPWSEDSCVHTTLIVHAFIEE